MDSIACTRSGESEMIINTHTNTTFPHGVLKMEHEVKKKKRKKHAIKIPSSLGLFIVDSSCFFVSGPGVQKKEGGEKRDKIQKDCICRITTKGLHEEKNSKTVGHYNLL